MMTTGLYSITYFATSAGNIIQTGIKPVVNDLGIIASISCTLFLIIGGYHYITSSGRPANLEHAKKIIKNALIGLVIVLAAVTINNLLSSSYGSVSSSGLPPNVPSLSAIKPSSSSALIDIIIKTITGVLGNIIETVGVPFIKALGYFTSGTPLVAANHSVLNLWLTMTAIGDALMTLVIILLGMHVMSFASVGFSELNIKHLLPQIGLGYLLINSSVFIIDTIISLSNLLIKAISNNQSTNAVWQSLIGIVNHTSGYSLAALIIMVIFLIFSVILLIYYVGRIVSIYLGAVLSPLVILMWLLPSLRDFAITTTKRYLTIIFSLFVQVVILELAAAIISGIQKTDGTNIDPLMGLIVGLATLVALLKTQGVMSHLSYAAIGPRSARRIAERLVLNMSYIGGQVGQAASSIIPTRVPANARADGSIYPTFNTSSFSHHNHTVTTNVAEPKKNVKTDSKGIQQS